MWNVRRENTLRTKETPWSPTVLRVGLESTISGQVHARMSVRTATQESSRIPLATIRPQTVLIVYVESTRLCGGQHQKAFVRIVLQANLLQRWATITKVHVLSVMRANIRQLLELAEAHVSTVTQENTWNPQAAPHQRTVLIVLVENIQQ